MEARLRTESVAADGVSALYPYRPGIIAKLRKIRTILTFGAGSHRYNKPSSGQKLPRPVRTAHSSAQFSNVRNSGLRRRKNSATIDLRKRMMIL